MSNTKTFIVSDLFKVYILWDSYIYLELLRPLERRDFKILTQSSNSLHFITDDLWDYTLIENKGKKPKFIAKFAICLNYLEELKKVILDNLDGVNDIQEIENSFRFSEIFSFSQTRVANFFSYQGCNSEKSKEKKRKKELKLLKAELEEIGTSKEEALYEKHLNLVIKNIDLFNNAYESQLLSTLKKDISIHEEIRKLYSPSIAEEAKAIKTKEEELYRLKEEIKEKEKLVSEEHKKLLKKAISTWENIPLTSKRVLSKEVDTFKIGSKALTSSLFDRDLIAIK